MTDQLRRVDVAVVAPNGAPARGPRLVIPEGWVIDEIACDRLVRQLDRAPEDVTGVVAGVGELPPGASYRVHAEWRALEPHSAVVEQPSRTARGAVLLRPGVEFDVRGDVIEVGSGPLILDSGAHVHDPWSPIGPLVAASELGRPPFPRRPVVVFLAAEGDGDLADWARRLVNRLVRRDVEARLALPEVAEGLHLTRPCLPIEDSIRALAPDVVVALDEAAVSHAPSWCGADRSTVVVELEDDVSMTTELVSWQIGHSSGRLRARVSRRVDAPTLAELVRRLCAGPHPMPPSDGAAREPAQVVVRAPTDRRSGIHTGRARADTAVVVTGTLDDPAARRVEGLCDHLAAARVAVTTAPLDGGIPAAARTTDLLMLFGIDGSEPLDGLLNARRDSGRPTVVDVGPAELAFDPANADAVPAVGTRAADLATASGMATAPGGAVLAGLRDLGVRCQELPTLLSRTRTAGLRESRAIGGFEPRPDPIVGWHVGSAGTPVPAYLEAVADALSNLLADRSDVRVEVVGDAQRVPAALRVQDRVTITSEEPEPDKLTSWLVHLWTPPILAGEVVDDLGSLVEAACAGVPSALPAASRGAIDGHVAAELVVTDAEQSEEWASVLHVLLDDEPLRVQRSRETFRQSSTIYGSVASKAVVNRFLGWALYGGTS